MSNAPFRWVKRVFFHRRVLWPVGGSLALGLPLVVFGKDRLVFMGYLLSVPFQFWVFTIGLVSGVLAIPRFVMLVVQLFCLCFLPFGLCGRITNWATKYEPFVNAVPQPRRGGLPDLVDTTMAQGNPDDEIR
ncbi:MAG: hypothetical protein ACKV2Q_19940 [Planctomycetaceae bacterium]